MRFWSAIVICGSVALGACSWQQRSGADGKSVKLTTPVGEVKVKSSAGASAADAGLDVYPGARKETSKERGAQARIELPFVRLKVVGTKYHSDDPPQKVLAFYRKGLAKYGKVEEERGGHTSVSLAGFDWQSAPDQVTLSAGRDDDEHLVAVRGDGTGSQFALVYVRTRDTDEQSE